MTKASDIPLGVVLAGGRSRRMGRDKAAMDLDGRTLLQRSVEALGRAGLEVLVVGRRADLGEGVASCEDDDRDRGPLGGLITALRRAGGRSILAVPCDVPDLDASAIRWLMERWREAPARCLATRRAGRVEPLFAVYVVTGLPILEDVLGHGGGSLLAGLDAVGARIIDLPPDLGGAVQDLDTPEDWRQRLGSDVRDPGP